jgi:cobaltochelatase CobS
MISQTEKVAFLTEAAKRYGNVVTRQQLVDLSSEGFSRHFWIENDKYRVGRGKYELPLAEFGIDLNLASNVVEMPKQTPAPVAQKPVAKISTVGRVEEGAVIPKVNPLYVAFGFFDKMKAIVNSKRFYPVFVSGLSGNGKTFMVEQACAQTKREFLRVNISPETDEDDLVGGFRLIDGETKWFDGPVIQAMKRGSVLVLDEIDRGSNKLMCLQGILEGKGILIKKTGEFVDPVEGFNIIATANTKGKGDETGRYMAATILDDAFLERFPITVEQEYPSTSIETKILKKVFASLSIQDEEFATNLVKWADIIRKTFEEGAIDELISTRRLVHIAEAYTIFGDKMDAIQYCINRFDGETKTSFLDLYTKIDAGIDPTAAKDLATIVKNEEEIPF